MANSVLAKMAVVISANTAALNKNIASSQNALNSFNKSITSLRSELKGLAVGFGVIEIGKDVIQTTSNFQKFAAVLQNTLGSDSQADRALKNIKDFAAATPFSVQELTGAFVKLANQGFKPTVEELRKLGDLASSTGKSFDQLAEAIIDAQTGEFERLKEFGIRASKEGDKVTFTFKGVKTQVDFTSESIQRYILSLGDLAGVSGSMAKISETLGGRISNLGDAWDNLMLSIGNGTAGPLSAAVESFTVLLNAMANLKNEMELIGQAVSPFHDLRDVSKETLDYLIKFGRTDTGKRLADVLKPFTSQENRQFLIDYDKNFKAFVSTLQSEGESLDDINVLWAHYVQTRIQAVKIDNEDLKQSRLAAVMKQKEVAQAAVAAAQADAAVRERLSKANNIKGPSSGNITGAGFLFDVGAIDVASNAIAAAVAKIDTSLINNQISLDNWGEAARQAFLNYQNSLVDFSGVAASAISGIGQALGAAISGSANFGEALLGVLGGVLVQLGEMLITAGVGVEAFKASLESLNGAVAIAAGVALVALGSAISGSIKGLGANPTSGMSSRSPSFSNNIGGLSSRGVELRIGEPITFRIQGEDLVYVLNRQEQLRGRRR